MAYQQTEQEELWMRMQQFLVHGYLYYVLDENIIPDYQYDRICKRFVELLNKYPEEAKQLPYYEVTGSGGEGSGSAFYIKDYPPQIATTAFRRLWYHKKNTIPDFNEDFEHFIGRWGRSLIKEEPVKKVRAPKNNKKKSG